MTIIVTTPNFNCPFLSQEDLGSICNIEGKEEVIECSFGIVPPTNCPLRKEIYIIKLEKDL